MKSNYKIGLLIEVTDNGLPPRSFLHSFATLVRAVISAIASFLFCHFGGPQQFAPHHPFL